MPPFPRLEPEEITPWKPDLPRMIRLRESFVRLIDNRGPEYLAKGGLLANLVVIEQSFQPAQRIAGGLAGLAVKATGAVVELYEPLREISARI